MIIPKYASSDHDHLFEHQQRKANRRILEIEELKSISYAPLSHPFIERLIGTLRREFLGHVLFWNTRDLGRKLEEYRDHYHCHRVHAKFSGKTNKPAFDFEKQFTVTVGFKTCDFVFNHNL